MFASFCDQRELTRYAQSVLCLLSLLLERHSKILELAQHHVLSEREFEAMITSVHVVAYTFGLRYSNLAEGWRQQRLDTGMNVQCFAAGIFESWHMEYNGVCLRSQCGPTSNTT